MNMANPTTLSQWEALQLIFSFTVVAQTYLLDGMLYDNRLI